MDKSEETRIIEEMQQVVAQMRIDDVEDNPECLNELFDCSCCGKEKDYAGSIQYGNYRLCNDCVLFAETGFALNKFKNVGDLVAAMEDKRLEELCEFIKRDEQAQNN